MNAHSTAAPGRAEPTARNALSDLEEKVYQTATAAKVAVLLIDELGQPAIGNHDGRTVIARDDAEALMFSIYQAEKHAQAAVKDWTKAHNAVCRAERQENDGVEGADPALALAERWKKLVATRDTKVGKSQSTFHAYHIGPVEETLRDNTPLATTREGAAAMLRWALAYEDINKLDEACILSALGFLEDGDPAGGTL